MVHFLFVDLIFLYLVLFRMETFTLATWRGRERLAGMVFDIGGAMMVTFDKGFTIKMWSTSVDLLRQLKSGELQSIPRRAKATCSNYFVSCICFFSIFLVIMVSVNLNFNKITFTHNWFFLFLFFWLDDDN